MASVPSTCIVVTLIVFSGNIAGRDAAAGERRQTFDHHLQQQLPFLRDLQTWGSSGMMLSEHTPQGQNLVRNMVRHTAGQVMAASSSNSGGSASEDVNRVMQMLNSVRITDQNGNRAEFQLTDGDPSNPESPSVSVVVETLSAQDLLTSERGRQQLSELSSLLQTAEKSLRLQMVQGPAQAEGMIEDVHNAAAAGETLLGGLLTMLGGQGPGRGDTLLGIAGSQTLQAMNQLSQTLDQLPALKDFLGKFYSFVQRLHYTSPGTTVQDMQRLLVSVFRSLQAANGEAGGQGGTSMEMESMLEMALKGLNASLEVMENMVHGLHGAANSPSFLQTVSATHCLVRSINGELSADLGAGCLQHVLQALATVNQSEQAIASLVTSLTHLLENPDTLQVVSDLMKMPSLDKAFNMITRMMEALTLANSDLVGAMQAVQTMLRTLWDNRPLLQTVANILQNPESSQVYESAMQFLKDAGVDSPATQQLLQVVNDSVTMLWQRGDNAAQNAVKAIQEILAALKRGQPASQPLSQSQQALLDLLQELLEASENAISGGTETPTPTIATTTVGPVDTGTTTTTATTNAVSTLGDRTTTDTGSQSEHTTRRTTMSGTSPTPSSSLSPATTRDPSTGDGNGSAALASSVFIFLVGLIASRLWK